MGEIRQPNRLIHEASPYLQQHAYNPVDWYPWGEEALQKAKAEQKPIFLSIGYAACHWCHVMERESFSDPDIAAILNKHFVCIKVDREERPDLDHLYQTICQLVTGGGGWPLSVWLTPEQKPFYVGTYFPPNERYGRPGFRQLLLALARAWQEKPEEVVRVSENWSQAIARVDSLVPPDPNLPDAETLTHAGRALLRRTDPVHGGFGGAPKFPNTACLELLLRHHRRTGDNLALERVTLTLRKMGEGGIYDQLGGGFHRYSVDERWAVPHFEKMLYDNALLPPVYLQAWQLTGDPLFRRIALETLEYVLREMTHPEGAFYSTTDADSEGEEGKYFLFDPADVEAAVGPDLADLMCRYYGVTPEGNFEATGKTVLHVAATPEELARQFGLSEAEVGRRLEEGRRKMLAYRQRRVPSFRDEKVLTAWNALMISALARAGRIFREPRYTEAAEKAAQFILQRLTDGKGGLLRRFRDGQSGIPGFLEDYAFMAAALLDLYEATFDEKHLQEAIRLARETIRRFYDGSGAFHLTPADGEPLLHRPRDTSDGSTPSGTGVAVMTLLRLLPFTGDDTFREIPEAVFRAHRQQMERMPGACATLLLALDLYLSGPTEVTLVGPAPEEWLKELGRLYVPNLVLTRTDSPRSDVPIWAGKMPKDHHPTIYVCRNFTCSPPLTSWEEARAYLANP